jgi:pimeloyl-ACP methyl ester carboxylesterase
MHTAEERLDISTRSTARFAQTPLIKVMRSVLSRLDRLSPAIAARLTYGLISAPPRHRAKPAERALISTSERWRVPFQGGWLQCYRWGSGPTCLFVHCWGGRGAQAHSMIRALVAAGFGVVSFDHPAHGDSSGRRAEMVRMAAAIAAVVRNIGVVETMIGHSLGVAAAAIALRDHQLEVARLVSISSLIDCVWFTEVIREYLGISSATVRRARQHVDECYARPVGWEQLSVPHMLRGLRLPILLMHDRDDKEIPFEHGLRLRQALPAAEFIETAGLGHRRILGDARVIAHVARFAATPRRPAMGLAA